MQRFAKLALSILLIVGTCLSPWKTYPASRSASAAPLAGSIAMVAGDTIDLKWDTGVYPFTASTYQRWELYRGTSPQNLSLLASGNGSAVDFYRDSGLALNTSFYYKLLAIRSDGTTTVIDSSESSGGLHGKLYHDLTLKANTYQFDASSAQFELLGGSILTVPANALLKGYESLSSGWFNTLLIKEGSSLVLQTASDLYGIRLNLASGVLLADGATFDQISFLASCDTSVTVCELEIKNSTWQDSPFIVSTVPSGASLRLRNNRFVDTAASFSTVEADNRIRSTSPDAVLQGNQGKFSLELLDVSQTELSGNTVEGKISVGAHAKLSMQNNTVEYHTTLVNDQLFTGDNWATINATGNVFSLTNGYVGRFLGEVDLTWIENDATGLLVIEDATQASVLRSSLHGSVLLDLDASGSITFEDNVFSGNNISLHGASHGSFQRNTLQNSYGWSLPSATDNDSTFLDNCMRDNTYGLRVSSDSSAPIFDFRNNYWGAASGPYHMTLNPTGQGDEILGTQVIFDPWRTSGETCRDQPPQTPRPTTLSLELPSDPVRADGLTAVQVRARLLDQFEQPITGQTISLSIDPLVGVLQPTSGTTDASGYVTANYTPPWIGDLEENGEIQVTALSGLLSDSGVLRFQKPAITIDAEPRYHQAGWPEQRALLPPDPNVFATLHARLVFDGDPVANFVVQVQLKPGSDGFYDGELLDASDPVGELTPLMLEVRSDANGELWVHYIPTAQSSRDDAVSDVIEISKQGFGYLDAWQVETGMDLQLVQVHRPAESTNGFVVMGQPEPLEINVRDRLHPRYLLSKYQDNPQTVTDPDTQAYLHVGLDISFPARDTQFLDLVNMAHLQIPRAASFDTYVELAPDGKEYLRTSHPSAIAGRPVIIPYMEEYNIYWLGINFVWRSNGLRLRDTYPIGEPDNNYTLIGFLANSDSDWFEEFIANNPCAASNTAFGRNFKCAVGLLATYPILKIPLEPATFALSLCEIAFDLYNGNYTNGALGVSGNLNSALVSYLEAHPEKLAETKLGPELFKQLKFLSSIGPISDCYWAYAKMDEPEARTGCGFLPAASLTYDQLHRQMELWTQALMMTAGPEMDALAIYGPTATQLRDIAGGAIASSEVSASGMLTETQGILSLGTDLGSFYLFPRGEYELTFETFTDTEVILYRQGITMTEATSQEWLTVGTSQRAVKLIFDSHDVGNYPLMLVDNSPYGSTDATILPTNHDFVDNPQNLKATVSANGGVTLTWDPVPEDTTNTYVVYYGTESRFNPLFDGYSHHALVIGGTSFTINGLDLNGQANYFAVTSVGTYSRESLFSAEAIAGSLRRSTSVYLPLVKR